MYISSKSFTFNKFLRMKKLFSMLINGYTKFKNFILFMFTGLSYSKKIRLHFIKDHEDELINQLTHVFSTKNGFFNGDSYENYYYQFVNKRDYDKISNDGVLTLFFNKKAYDFKFSKSYIDVKYNHDSYDFGVIWSICWCSISLASYLKGELTGLILIGIVSYIIGIIYNYITQRFDYTNLKREFEFFKFIYASKKYKSIS